MVGRIVTFDLYPFNFREYLRANDKRLESIYAENNEQVINSLWKGKGLKKRQADPFGEELRQHYEKFCIWGGYPAVVLAGNNAIRSKLLADTYNNYILKDIKTLLELATEKNLLLLSQYLATQTGNIVVYQNLSQTAHLDVCREVRPFFTNRQKELTKNPKIFFMDMGFRNNLMENMNSLAVRPDAGAIVENVVFIRLNELCSRVQKINFWRTKAGAEVDFVIHKQDALLPVEVKYAGFKSEKVSRSLASFIDTFKPGCAVVLTKDFWGSGKKEKTRILFIPVYYL
jgi:predicted AAA+ superfamily ATPase